METTIKASNILMGPSCVFINYQIAMADKIFNLIQDCDYKELGKLINTIKTKLDYE